MSHSFIDPDLRLKVLRLPHLGAIPLPAYQSAGAAGLDLYAACADWMVLHEDQPTLVPTGIAVEIPHGFEGQVRARSSVAKRGLIVANAPGTVDCDYRGEIMVMLLNVGRQAVQIARGERIAQLVIAPVLQLPVEEVGQLSTTQRGAGGFGSTGT